LAERDDGADHQGIGTLLVGHIETFAKAQGFSEIGLESLIDKQGTQEAHKAWVFSETERVAYFRKRFGP
jgi:hypothetical protein